MMDEWNDFERDKVQDEKMQILIDNCVALKLDPELVDKSYVYTTEEREYSEIWTKEDVHDNEPIYYYYRIQIIGLRKDGYDQESKYLFVQNWGAFDTINHRKRSDYLPLVQCLKKFVIQSAERSRNFVFAKIKDNDISRSPLPESVQKLIVDYIFNIVFLKKMIDEYTFDVKNTVTEFLNINRDINFIQSSLSGYLTFSSSNLELESKRQLVRDLLNKKITNKSDEQAETTTQSFSLMNFYYKQLHTTIEVLDKENDRYKIIEKYFNGTQSSAHYINVTMHDVFVIERPCDSSRYTKDFKNKQLLWHGTSPSNIPSILYEGFRTTKANRGGMFGSGTYFANAVSKSVQYCRSRVQGILLLCEVALGETEKFYSAYQLNDDLDLPKGKNSVHGVGVNTPDTRDFVIVDEDVLVPYGRLSRSKDSKALLQHDEFIVYNPAQIKMRYLVTFGYNK